MSKMAEAKYPIHPLIQKRWSPRAFAERMVEPEKLRSLFEAARWAASSRNEQPWRFILATKENQADFERLLNCLSERNRQWARRAPVLMVVVAKRFFDHSNQENRVAFHDVGLAMGNLILQATALDLYGHMMGGFSIEKAYETFSIPETHEPVAAVAVGYLGDPETLPESMREREQARRTRKDLTEFVFSGNWGNIAPLVR